MAAADQDPAAATRQGQADHEVPGDPAVLGGLPAHADPAVPEGLVLLVDRAVRVRLAMRPFQESLARLQDQIRRLAPSPQARRALRQAQMRREVRDAQSARARP